jgi:hypothetical protein
MNRKIQNELLQFIADYNDGKIIFLDPCENKMDKGKIREGIGHKKYIWASLEVKFIDNYKYDKEDVNENLRLLSEDNKIKIIPKEDSDLGYLETENPIFLTTKGYNELSIFKRYPWVTGIGLTAGIVTIINGLPQFVKIIELIAIYIISYIVGIPVNFWAGR